MWPRNVAKDLEATYVEDLSVLTDGKPLPDVIRTGDAIPVVLRFRIPAAREDEAYIPYFMIVGPKGYDRGGQPDAIEAFPQSRARDAPGTSLTVVRNGRVVDLTPKLPPEGDTHQQFCALIEPSLFRMNGSASGPLELHLWLYRKSTTPNAVKRFAGEGHLVFMHKFEFEKSAEPQALSGVAND
jgi:hypothetical protein